MIKGFEMMLLPSQENIGVASGREFMTIEFFWESLLLRQIRNSGTQMPSAQDNFYALVAYSGPFQYGGSLEMEWN
jgi:hypothetical protein